MTEIVDPATAATVTGVGSTSLSSDASTHISTKTASPRQAVEPIAIDDPKLREHAEAIRDLGKKTVESICEIGRHLAVAKKIAGRGRWLPWLQQEFNWTDRTATNFIRVYEMKVERNFENFSKFSLPVSCLYLISAPNTPPEVRDEVLKQAEAGQKVSVAEVKGKIATAKGADDKRRYVSSARAERMKAVRSPQVTAEGLIGWWNTADHKGRSNFFDAVGVHNVWSEMRQVERDDIIARYAPVNIETTNDVVIKTGEIGTGIPDFLNRNLKPAAKTPDSVDLPLHAAAIEVAKLLASHTPMERKEICRRALESCDQP